MNRARLARLEQPERAAPGNGLIVFINKRFYDANGNAVETEEFRDSSGNAWRREPGETFENLRKRARAGATAAAPGGVAVIFAVRG